MICLYAGSCGNRGGVPTGVPLFLTMECLQVKMVHHQSDTDVHSSEMCKHCTVRHLLAASVLQLTYSAGSGSAPEL